MLALALAGCGQSQLSGTNPAGDRPGDPGAPIHASDDCAPNGAGPAEATGKPSVGVNYNGMSRNVDLSPGGELKRVDPEWVRAFVDMQQLLGKSAADIAADSDVAGIRSLHSGGYRSIVSLKWPFQDRDFPHPGTKKMQSYVNTMHRVLDGAGPGVDIVVVGNEPFRETKPSYRDKDLVRFYEAMATEIDRYRKRQCRTFELFLGSFNNVHAPEERTPAVKALIEFAGETSWIAGIDLHVHHKALRNLTDSLAWARSRIPAAKQIIITEFSLVQHWREENTKPIPATFAKKYGYSTALPAYKYLNQANRRAVPRAEWIDYMSSTSWISSRRHYIANSYAGFKKYHVSIATYGLRQGKRVNKPATSLPWSYNSIFCNVTCQPTANGRSSFNYAWINDFRRIRKGELG